MEIDSIIKMMQEMRLPQMASSLEQIINDPDYSNRKIIDVINEITSAEYLSRKENTMNRRIKQAKFSEPSARLENLNPTPDRNINMNQIQQLSTNEYIRKQRDVIILGASGTGKSFIGNALGINACKQLYKVKYMEMSDLLNSFQEARIQGKLKNLFESYFKIDLFIIDDFLLTYMTEKDISDLVNFINQRHKHKSTIICSQSTPSEWHDKLNGGYQADSILDRITNNAFLIDLKGESQRRIRNEIV